jgi:ubiquinol-cytochrome c reductase cytochrome c1 subunit
MIALLFAPLAAVAASGDVVLDRAHIDTGDAVSIQRGARTFVNYCLNCHSASYMRYNRLQDVGLSEQQIKDNLLLTDAKVGDTMKAAISAKDGKQWFGVAPPDLSVTARSRGADWLYTYMRTFYRDPARSTGWNNLAFPNVGMPHVLWELQGMQRLEVSSHEAGGHKVEQKKLVLETPGALSPAEYDRLVLDLVNYMVFMGEPVRAQRVQVGIAVLFFLSIMLLLTWLLKREYWKDVH